MSRTSFFVLALVPGLASAAEPSLSQLSFAGSPLSMMGMLALMSLLPFAVMMLTSFSKIAVVLSLARSAMGTQQAPPTIVLTGLAAVLTGHIMAPVMERMYDAGQAAYHEVGSGAQMLGAASKVSEPLRTFLVKHGDAEERARFLDLARELRPVEEAELVHEDDLFVVIPAFVITELKEAFQIGFLIFLPFLVL
ncbi:MAG TPA: EscR/YscR/HrcR family type III secretion system export apparatus protein, partial [Myxococcaceae bacterium]|nr:EscR/YscR/HrcR family type III secretion system export apparatus protein [Myxococcaceae bacterium]